MAVPRFAERLNRFRKNSKNFLQGLKPRFELIINVGAKASTPGAVTNDLGLLLFEFF
jgi:hypothetical protein